MYFYKKNKVQPVSKQNFSAEITVGDNKYSGLCSEDGTPIGNWTLKRGEDPTISIKFQNNSFIEDKTSSPNVVLGYEDLGGGEYYIGEFKDGKFDGQGTYTYADGDKYVGEFKEDKFDGKGTYTFADGKKYVGDWQDGEMMKSSNKSKEKNKIPTLLLRSEVMNK